MLPSDVPSSGLSFAACCVVACTPAALLTSADARLLACLSARPSAHWPQEKLRAEYERMERVLREMEARMAGGGGGSGTGSSSGAPQPPPSLPPPQPPATSSSGGDSASGSGGGQSTASAAAAGSSATPAPPTTRSALSSNLGQQATGDGGGAGAGAGGVKTQRMEDGTLVFSWDEECVRACVAWAIVRGLSCMGLRHASSWPQRGPVVSAVPRLVFVT
jgi:hypothetical protein